MLFGCSNILRVRLSRSPAEGDHGQIPSHRCYRTVEEENRINKAAM
jgi:hypothetical protein